MAQHGYLREGYGIWGDYDPDERSDRDRGRDRDFMFEDRDRFRGRGDRSDAREWFGGGERSGPFARGGDEARSWFRDMPDGEPGRLGRGDEARRTGSAWEDRRGRRRDRESGFGSSQDDHYRSWRNSQMEALDRDYADYCREREQQFHQDFDSWRRGRQQPQSRSQQGRSDQAGLGSPSVASATTSVMGTAAVGTDNSESIAETPTTTGRSRR